MSTKSYPSKTRYTYNQNNPVNFRDLWGLSAGDIAACELDDSTQLWEDSLKSVIENNNASIQPDACSEVVILHAGENK